MKKISFIPHVILSLSCILQNDLAAAQSKARDCYGTYINRGNSYTRTKNYDLAIQQFKAAKYCDHLTRMQRRTLDSLIEDANIKRNPGKKKGNIRKF